MKHTKKQFSFTILLLPAFSKDIWKNHLSHLSRHPSPKPLNSICHIFFLLQNLWARSAKGSAEEGNRRKSSTQDRNKRNMAKAQGATARDP